MILPGAFTNAGRVLRQVYAHRGAAKSRKVREDRKVKMRIRPLLIGLYDYNHLGLRYLSAA